MSFVRPAASHFVGRIDKRIWYLLKIWLFWFNNASICSNERSSSVRLNSRSNLLEIKFLDLLFQWYLQKVRVGFIIDDKFDTCLSNHNPPCMIVIIFFPNIRWWCMYSSTVCYLSVLSHQESVLCILPLSFSDGFSIVGHHSILTCSHLALMCSFMFALDAFVVLVEWYIIVVYLIALRTI